MRLPIRRSDDDSGRQLERQFERLREPFSEQLDRWPDFVRPLHSMLDAAAPKADLEETDDSYLLEVELPGIRRRDVELQVDGGRLVLTAQRHERERVGLLRHRTRTTGRYALSFSFPAEVDVERVQADLDSGVLSVVLPKAAGARRRRIAVQAR